MVEPQPSKLATWVRFPSPALPNGGRDVGAESHGRGGSEVHPRVSNSAETSRISLGILYKWGEGAECEFSPSATVCHTPLCLRETVWVAAVAQPVERVLGKDEVMGSNPISSSVGTINKMICD